MVVSKTREKQFWMSEVEGDTHHLISYCKLGDVENVDSLKFPTLTERRVETNLTLDTIVINIPQENELDIMVGLALLLHLVDQPLVVVRPDDRLVHQVLGGLQGGAA